MQQVGIAVMKKAMESANDTDALLQVWNYVNQLGQNIDIKL